MKQINVFIFKALLFAILVLSFSFITLGQDATGASPTWQRGNSNAKYTIEVFNDYQCPTCAAFHKKLKEIVKRHSGKVLIIFRNYPLLIVHKNAMSAAQAVEAAGKQGKFWEMLEIVYQKQNKWSQEDSVEKFFIKYAKNLDLNIKTFKQDFQSQEILERINLDIKRGKSLKVNSTPSVFLNGEILTFSDAENLEEIISNSK